MCSREPKPASAFRKHRAMFCMVKSFTSAVTSTSVKSTATSLRCKPDRKAARCKSSGIMPPDLATRASGNECGIQHVDIQVHIDLIAL